MATLRRACTTGKRAQLAQELEAAFEQDLGSCRAFEVAAYERHPALSRWRDSAARLLSPLM